jgi:hypothetical protein
MTKESDDGDLKISRHSIRDSAGEAANNTNDIETTSAGALLEKRLCMVVSLFQAAPRTHFGTERSRVP